MLMQCCCNAARPCNAAATRLQCCDFASMTLRRCFNYASTAAAMLRSMLLRARARTYAWPEGCLELPRGNPAS
eukprot:7739981-Lingulodinium_polyedra.AAC.1